LKKLCKFFLIIVIVTMVAFSFSACNKGAVLDSLVGTEWTMDADQSTLSFESSTWKWTGLEMNDTNEVKQRYNFEGNYTHNGDTVNLTANRFQTDADTEWTPWSGRWTVELLPDNKIDAAYTP
jgi:hypothetical protein